MSVLLFKLRVDAEELVTKAEGLIRGDHITSKGAIWVDNIGRGVSRGLAGCRNLSGWIRLFLEGMPPGTQDFGEPIFHALHAENITERQP
jgi:hypothetical protein